MPKHDKKSKKKIINKLGPDYFDLEDKRALMRHAKGKSALHMNTMIRALQRGATMTRAHKMGLMADMREKRRKRMRKDGTRQNPIDLTGSKKKKKKKKKKKAAKSKMY
jgi:hypothetical protein